MDIILVILGFLNLTAFIVMGIDKSRAVKRKWRVPEKVFFVFAIIGSCPGIYLGMHVFRHKTKKWYFIYGLPFIFIAQIAVLYFLNKGVGAHSLSYRYSY